MVRLEGNPTVTVWQDKRLVTSLSTANNPDQTEVVKRKKVDQSVIQVDCPVSVVGTTITVLVEPKRTPNQFSSNSMAGVH